MTGRARAKTEEKRAPNFDGIARAYRWMEYAAVGTLLERVRWRYLDAGALDGCKRALVLGDGDGRFTARMMRRCVGIEVTAVDGSGKMLGLLRRRCEGMEERLKTVQGDARGMELGVDAGEFAAADLVVTHFFLDCLTQEEVEAMVRKVRQGLEPGATWLLSEFATPQSWMRWPARICVRGLYEVFGMLTGLKVKRLPDYEGALRRAGFAVEAERRFAGGLLVTQVLRLAG